MIYKNTRLPRTANWNWDILIFSSHVLGLTGYELKSINALLYGKKLFELLPPSEIDPVKFFAYLFEVMIVLPTVGGF